GFSMEEGKKKPIMVGVIVLCFVLAGVMWFRSSRRGGPDLREFRGEMIWALCRNPKCGHAWQMDKEKFFLFIEKNADPRSILPPPLTCPKCGEPSGYRAVKCAKCGAVFEMGSVPGDFSDKCPDCGYSQIAVDRKKAAEERKKAAEKKKAAENAVCWQRQISLSPLRQDAQTPQPPQSLDQPEAA
ncbi:unnamed protein product, partial [marine sediment metagenome]